MESDALLFMMKNSILHLSIFIICLFPSLCTAEKNESNNGENITRPLTRFDLRLKYQTGVNESVGRAVTLTARTDKKILLMNDWQMSLRADLPYQWFFCDCNPCHTICAPSTHMADSLFQVLFIPPPIKKITFAFGSRFIFPTAGDNLIIGQGKYQILPSFAFSYDLSEWNEGAYWGVLFQHAYDVGGYKSAPYINQTFIQPFLNINLTKKWFVNFSPQIVYNWRIEGWSVPFDMMLGVMLTKKIVLSAEYAYAFIDEYQLFRQELELRIGFFF